METLNVASRREWLSARKALLIKEKQLTKELDALNRARRELPLVKIDKNYVFEGPKGSLSLDDLFEGRRQLIIYHFMFHRDKGVGCVGCSFMADNMSGLAHLNARGVTLALVSRAPLAEIAPFQKRMGWSMPWYSSFGSDFNYDFHATTDEKIAPVEYNYRSKAELEAAGENYHVEGEQPGASVFVRRGEDIYHSYSTYGRGLDMLLGVNHWSDLTPDGRGEGWDGMPNLKIKTRFHDEYEKTPTACGCGA